MSARAGVGFSPIGEFWREIFQALNVFRDRYSDSDTRQYLSLASLGEYSPEGKVHYAQSPLFKKVRLLMQQPNAQLLVEVTKDELPLHCPTPDSSLWNSHPRVFIPLDDSPEASCSYCGTVYRLVDKKSSAAASSEG